MRGRRQTAWTVVWHLNFSSYTSLHSKLLYPIPNGTRIPFKSTKFAVIDCRVRASSLRLTKIPPLLVLRLSHRRSWGLHSARIFRHSKIKQLYCTTSAHMTSSLYWHTTQCWLVVRYRRFGTTCGSNIQGSNSPVFLDWTLRNWCTYTLFYSPEDKRWNYFLFGSIIFHSCVKCLGHIFVYINTYTNIIRVCLWGILLSASHSYVQVYLWSLNTSQCKIKISFSTGLSISSDVTLSANELVYMRVVLQSEHVIYRD